MGDPIKRGPPRVFMRPLDPREGNEFKELEGVTAVHYTLTGNPPPRMTAAERWMAVDWDDGDYPSLAEMGMPHLFPDRPGEVCADLTATSQLYWPGSMPWDPQLGGELEMGEVIRVDGNVLCQDCGLAYYEHPLAPWPLDYNRERFLRRLCDGHLGKT